MAMQGSCIAALDVGSATVTLGDDGMYILSIGAADMGTGCDTTLSQIVAECMDCSVDEVSVSTVNTDTSPYDSGSYASSTIYVTGKAVELACDKLKGRLCRIAAQMLNVGEDDVEFTAGRVQTKDGSRQVSVRDISYQVECNSNLYARSSASHSSPVSPPPYMVGMVEIELDKETGSVEVLDFTAVVDCGTAINPNLVRVQTEGGLVQGIGMALYEDIHYTAQGGIVEKSFLQYKLPTRLDIGKLHVEIESSYEPTGPFGAKSIGEIVINTPSPAIAHAVYRATNTWHRELPITPEKILMAAP